LKRLNVSGCEETFSLNYDEKLKLMLHWTFIKILKTLKSFLFLIKQSHKARVTLTDVKEIAENFSQIHLEQNNNPFSFKIYAVKDFCLNLNPFFE
jgi:hypothetical protein